MVSREILGDCLIELPKLIAEGIKVDLVLTDMPYGVTRAVFDKKLPLDKVWPLINGITRATTPVLLFGQGAFFAELILSNSKYFRYDLVWNKILTTGFLNANKMPLRVHEQIAVFYKKAPVYNPQFSEGRPLHSKGTAYKNKKGKNSNYGQFTPVDTLKGNTKKYPISIIDIQKPHPCKAIHPTEKPTELLEYCINTYTNIGDTVLDFCAGSGSLAEACLNTGRGYICIEKNPQEYSKMLNRIAKNMI